MNGAQLVFFFLFLFHFSLAFGTENSPILKTNIGEFEGKLLRFDDVEIEAFYGLPFAEPPKRFEKPEPPKPHTERRLALEQKPACPQLSFRRNSTILLTNEDCLYLNLLKPKTLNNELLPLVIFIHGGAYQSGSAHGYTNDYLAKNYVAKGIAVAIIQYRLGFFGFASNGDSDFGGNYGLWDSRQALLWLRENAELLGLDRERITLWGYSAGASMISHMSLSPQTKDLFSQVIQMSGSSFNEWSLSESAPKTTRILAQDLNCNHEDSNGLKECFQKFDVDDLIEAVRQIKDSGLALNHNKFAPRLDNDFFPEDPLDLLRVAEPKPTLNTILENEALVFVVYENFNTSYYMPKSQRDEFDQEKFEQTVKQELVTEERFGDRVDEVVEKIMNFYVKRHKSTTKDNNFYLAQYSHFIGDQILSVSQAREIRDKLQYGWPMFTILNVHRENLKRTYTDPVSYETVHGSDFPYLFGIPLLGDINFTETDLKFRDKLIGAVVNFVKNGNPNKENEDEEFVEATKENPLLHTELTHETTIKNALFEEKLKFWEEIMNTYGYDAFRGRHLAKREKQEL